VEAALSEQPGVGSSAVIGLTDSDLGQRVRAVIEAAVPIPGDELRAFLGAARPVQDSSRVHFHRPAAP
jgi:bile acid-coenzyme A ligase